jgi:hypothetical protein
MAQADSAHSTSAPATSLAIDVPANKHPSYRDLNASDGSICLSALMTIAVRQACRERTECRRHGYDQPWRKYLSEALKRVWEIAKSQRDAILATRAPVARLSRADALQRELELLTYREDYRAAEARRRAIESELRHLAN